MHDIKLSQNMTMKSLNKLKNILSIDTFDLEFESQMVQSRIVSTLLEVIDDKKLKQKDLEELTGLSQPFISALFHNRKKLNVEHIALFQKALDIVLQTPTYLDVNEHKRNFYSDSSFYNEDLIKSFDDIHIISFELNEISYNYRNQFLKDELIEMPITRKKENKVFDYA